MMMTEREPGKMDFDEERDEDEVVQELFEVLLEQGALEILGYDHQNEPVYRFTQKCARDFPELYAIHQAEVNKTANELRQLGMVDINFNDEDMTVTVTEDNYRNLRDYGEELSEEHLSFLQALVMRKLADEDRYDS